MWTTRNTSFTLLTGYDGLGEQISRAEARDRTIVRYCACLGGQAMSKMQETPSSDDTLTGVQHEHALNDDTMLQLLIDWLNVPGNAGKRYEAIDYVRERNNHEYH